MSHSAVKRINVSTGLFEDEKIRLISAMPEGDALLIVWLQLLLLAGRINCRGEIFLNDSSPYSETMLASVFNRKESTVRMALRTFKELRMISVESDGTIVLSNWSKYQYMDGLDKIREDQRRRQQARRDRLRLNSRELQRALPASSRDASRDMSHAVTENCVTVTPLEEEEEYKREKKKLSRDSNGQNLPPEVGDNSSGGVESQDAASLTATARHADSACKHVGSAKDGVKLSALVSPNNASGSSAPPARIISDDALDSIEEAQRLFGELCLYRFNYALRPNQWSHELQRALADALPIPRPFFAAIDWAYRLEKDNPAHPIFAKSERHPGLQLRQSFPALLKNIVGEAQKIASARKASGLDAAAARTAPREEPADWQRLYRAKYPEAELPGSFWKLDAVLRAEYPALQAEFGGAE